MTPSGLAAYSRLIAGGGFQFQKSRQLFIRAHNETLSVVAIKSVDKHYFWLFF